MEFLLDYQLTNDDISKIEALNSKNILNNIALNKDSVKDIVDYLIGLGVTNKTLSDLFTYQIGIFFRTTAELKKVFDEYEIDSIVKSLNYDVNTIDLIDFV